MIKELKRVRKRKVRDRIAMISTHGYLAKEPPLGAADTGGQVVYVLEISKKLAELGYKVDIYTRRFEGQAELERVNANVTIFRLPCGGQEFIPKEYLYVNIQEWTKNALRFIKRNKFKYQFINSHYWDAGIAGQRLAQDLDVVHVHTPHSLGIWKRKKMEADFPEDKENFENKYNFSQRIRHETLIYREANLVIATTPPQVDILKKEYDFPKARIRMIPPGYDDNRFFPVGKASRDAIRERFGFKGKVITSLGRLALNKGFDLLIEAFSVVAEREKAAQLILAIGHEGMEQHDKELFQELKILKKNHKFGRRIKLIGYIEEDDLADFYRASDIFALPSRYEPFGMTAIEAMACGVPTVITTHGGLFRVLAYGQNVLAADPFDKEDFGITLLKAIRYNPLADRLSREGARRVRSIFTWTGIAQKLLSIVEDRESYTFRLTEILEDI